MRFESTASRVRSSGACHSISSSKVRLASSIIAHSSPSTSGVDAPLLVAELGQAERVRQPLGRIDRQHRHLLARAPPCRARSPPRWSSCRRRPSRRRCRPPCAPSQSSITAPPPARRESSSNSRGPSSGSNRNGSVVTGRAAPRRSRSRCSRWPRRGVLGQRRPQRCLRAVRTARRAAQRLLRAPKRSG